ncbi:unnamed protein product [Mycena citricolor]|uniref:Uncharacterized protein n=1 Tax=Mycena citricolor TaxID=2018698 RepID=A0AAD2HHC0_9AGAR|nr:unnamed protein product [Mycena citricolor]
MSEHSARRTREWHLGQPLPICPTLHQVSWRHQHTVRRRRALLVERPVRRSRSPRADSPTHRRPRPGHSPRSQSERQHPHTSNRVILLLSASICSISLLTCFSALRVSFASLRFTARNSSRYIVFGYTSGCGSAPPDDDAAAGGKLIWKVTTSDGCTITWCVDSPSERSFSVSARRPTRLLAARCGVVDTLTMWPSSPSLALYSGSPVLGTRTWPYVKWNRRAALGKRCQL